MRYFLVLFLLFVPAITMAANVFVSPKNVTDLIRVNDPETARTYYGELAGFPHTYEIRATEPFMLYAQLLEPVSKDATKNLSLIVIRERDNGRGVETIGRLRAGEATWDSVKINSNQYRDGGTFDGQMQSGVYRVEVSTQINRGKYALVLGATEQEAQGYFTSLREAYRVQQFLGKPPVMMITNPRVFIPFLLLLSVFGFLYLKKKQYA